ncbi:MAG: putative metal-binding motif-containing protein [Deltaproteobacteria bacterium]|nr:putative metal-binding motif-containing protein [Deltaproteobacteria bacterium]
MSSRAFWQVIVVSALACIAGCGGSPDVDASVSREDAGLDAAPSCSLDEDCEDGLVCNGESRCEGGRCVRGIALDCDDTIACTTDVCSEELRGCAHRALDADADGHAALSCLDARGMPLGDDCDDAVGTTHPGAREQCDASGVDEDCDPSTLGGRDGDGDGFIDAQCCNGSVCGEDCNDAVRGASPEGSEVCNAIDDDCDGRIDEGVLVVVYRDLDGDGHGDPSTASTACATSGGVSTLDDDCDDTSALRSPSLFEACDGIDNDCDGTPDPADVPDVVSWYEDVDGDGFGDPARETRSCARPSGTYSLLGTDCDDDDRARHPAQAELCNGIDDDCNGAADYVITAGDLEDDDLDGRPDAACTPRPAMDRADCDDRSSASGPGASEICDGRDNDCDASIDEGVAQTSYFRDADGDGWGSDASGVIFGCGSTPGYLERAGDCDDADVDRHPTMSERCNERDEDCDGRVDEELGAESCTSIDTPRACIAGRCRDVLTCDAPTADCDGLAGNGCEADVTADPSNCGACGVVCPTPVAGTVPICVSESCGVACREGRDDCNGSLEVGDGCETTLGTDAHCARCGDACPAMTRCNALSRVCEPTGGCLPGRGDCDMNGSCETDLSTDVRHCGACARECTGLGAGWRCVSSTCRVESCTGSRLNCDAIDANGCETDGATLSSCRVCGRACTGMNASWTCAVGGCEVIGCSPGFGDCDGLHGTGCETSTSTNPLHCGVCGRACSEPRASGVCVAGLCGALGCEPGYLDCNGDLGTGGDGCETMAASCPSVRWAVGWGTIGDDTPRLDYFLTAMDVDVDASGNAYVLAGYSTETLLASTTYTTAAFGALVVSFDPAGAIRWVHNLNGTTSVNVIALRLVVRGSSVFIAGSAGGAGDLRFDTTTIASVTAPAHPMVLSLSTSTGALSWSRLLATTTGADARALDVSNSGATVYVGGYVASDLAPGVVAPLSGSDDGFVVVLAGSDGATLDADLVGGTGFQSIEALAHRDSDGDYFLGGIYSGSSWTFGGRTFTAGGNNDGWLLRCSGALSGCAHSVAIATPSDEGITDVRVGPARWAFSGRYTTSTTVGSTTLIGASEGGFVGAVDYTSSTVAWAVGHAGTVSLVEGIRRIRYDATGNLRLVFGTTGGGTFAGAPIPTDGIVSPYFARIGNTGTLIEFARIASTHALEPLCLAARADGTNVIGGAVASAGVLGGVSYGSPGNGDPIVFSTRPF